MEEFVTSKGIVFCSKGIIEEFKEEFKKMPEAFGEKEPYQQNIEERIEEYLTNLDSALEEHGCRAKQEELAKLYCEINRLDYKNRAILLAHGFFKKGQWFYIDNKKEYLVQKWINKYDRKFGILEIHCCNPNSVVPSSKKSVIFWFNNYVSEKLINSSEVQLELYVPSIGVVDNYVIDFYIKKFRKLVEKLKNN